MNAVLYPAGEQSPVPLRDRLEAEIERLISLLDTLDGDPDLEPWLGDNSWGITDDREGGDVLDMGEPSLGWVTLASGRIITGSDTDLELA